MKTCIVCGEDSGCELICDKCKEGIMYARVKYWMDCSDEPSELEKTLFESVYNKSDISEVVNESIDIEADISIAVQVIKDLAKDDPSFRGRLERTERFIDYVKNRMREDYAKRTK